MIARLAKFEPLFKDHVAVIDEHHNTQWDCIIEFSSEVGNYNDR